MTTMRTYEPLVAALGLAVLTAFSVAADAQSQDYSIADLGGRAPAAAFDVNAAGRIVGSITPDDDAQAALWRRAGEAPLELEMLPGTNFSRAFGINARAQIVGQAQDRTVSPPLLFAVFWESEHDVPVALVSGTIAVAVNDGGEIAGNMRTAAGELHAAIWTDVISEPVDLGTLGGTSSSASDVNEAGQVVGRARDATGVIRAAFWPSPDAAPVDLGAPPDALSASANGINEHGEIVGDFLITMTIRRALFWSAAGVAAVELQSLGGDESQAVAIDDRGRIVGWSATATGERHACLWPSAFDPSQDLGTLGSGTSFARAINSRGQIVGDDGAPAASRAVIWRRTKRVP